MNDLQTAVADQQTQQQQPLPAPDHATTAFTTHTATMLDSLRAEQHHCDDMIQYWTERHADVSRTIEGIQAAHRAIHAVAPRDTTVVKRQGPPARKRVTEEDKSNA